jgi:DNA invertase Pin-like site-specific DNA recombinase
VLIEFFRSKNVQLVSVTENFDETAVGQFMRNAAAFAAEYEYEKLKERTTRGRTSILSKGQLLGAGQPTYGLCVARR